MYLMVYSGILLNWGVWISLFSQVLGEQKTMTSFGMRAVGPQRSHQERPWYGWHGGGDGCRGRGLHMRRCSSWICWIHCQKETRCSLGWCRLCPSLMLFLLLAAINMNARDYGAQQSLDNSSSTLWFIFSDIMVPKRGFLSPPVQHRSTPTKPPEIDRYIPAHGWHSCPRLFRW